MNAPDAFDWELHNRQALEAALGQIEALLEAAGGADLPPAPHPEGSALAHLCAAFDLSPFERDILLLCAAVELRSRTRELVAGAGGGDSRPTFSLALAVLPEAHWSALAPASPLRYWYLVEVDAGPTLTGSPLRIDERILHFLAGVGHPDQRLQGLVETLPATGSPDAFPLASSQQRIAERIAALWNGAGQRRPPLQLCAPAGHGVRQVAARGCAAAGLGLRALSANLIPAAAAERESLLRLWEREAILDGGALLLECDRLEAADPRYPVADFARRLRTPLLIAAPEPVGFAPRESLRLDLPKPGAEEQQRLWSQALGPAAGTFADELDALVAQFDLAPDDIEALGRSLALGAAAGEDATPWAAARERARSGLGALAQRIEPAAGWDDLVLPQPQLRTLHEIEVQVRQRTRVYRHWGFAAKSARGLGIGALFSGPSGTGKTMAAEVLAGALQLDLYRIDLSAVVSKYIGETEKNLRRVFDAAEASGAVLLFDEADALFGRRSEVKDSHDRYANIEVSYLLQRMESYRGLAILTTNLKQALDGAFLRRIRFIVPFPFPDAGQRAEIWRRIFPAQTPTDGLEPERLAQLNVAGGNIRNIALGAAFMAAEAGEAVRMGHLLAAARSEYAKLDRPLSAAEIGGWQ
jgi:hypothetical protein